MKSLISRYSLLACLLLLVTSQGRGASLPDLQKRYADSKLAIMHSFEEETKTGLLKRAQHAGEVRKLG